MYSRAFPVGNALFFFAGEMSLFRLPRGKFSLPFFAVPAGKDGRVECPCQTVDDFIGIGGKCLWTFSFCSNARSFDRPTVAKPGEKIKVPIFIRRKGAEVFCPALAAGGSLMAYKCLSLCRFFFFKGFCKSLFQIGFDFSQVVSRPLHCEAENLLLFRVSEIAGIVFERFLP